MRARYYAVSTLYLFLNEFLRLLVGDMQSTGKDCLCRGNSRQPESSGCWVMESSILNHHFIAYKGLFQKLGIDENNGLWTFKRY